MKTVTNLQTRTPLPWYGGKTHMLDFILPYFPPHIGYGEVFGGSGATLFAKSPSLVEVYNDLDSGLVNFFRVLQQPAIAERLGHLLWYAPARL
jgi:DNA adenine methylase